MKLTASCSIEIPAMAEGFELQPLINFGNGEDDVMCAMDDMLNK